MNWIDYAKKPAYIGERYFKEPAKIMNKNSNGILNTLLELLEYKQNK